MDVEGFDVVGREVLVFGKGLAVLEDPPRAPEVNFIMVGFGQVVLERVVKRIEATQESGLVKSLAIYFGYIEDRMN